MAKVSVPGYRLGRAVALSMAMLIACGILAYRQTEGYAKAPPVKSTAALKTGDDGEAIRLINEKLAEQWKANKLTPSARASDYEYIRRASLDIIGRIAKPEEIQRFLKDPSESRRRLLVDRLLSSDEYAENWANIWRVWLMTRSGALDENRAIYHEQMRLWLKEEFAKLNLSWKELVTELVTASGKTNENGAVNFILSHLGESIPQGKRAEEGYFEMVPVTSRVTRLFLGLQTQCTQCHDHPFNPEWKQQHFWGINAFFRQVKRDGVVPMRRQDKASVLTLAEDGTVNRDAIVFFEKRNGVVLPTRPVFLDGTKLEQESPGNSRRQSLALFLTRHEHFPRAFVNRLWGHFFGRGFTNPVDDFGEHNPVTNPELLDGLAKKFVDYGYNPRQVIRWICTSDAYNLSSVANSTNDKPDAEPFFSRMLLKSMSPEQLYESLLIATRAEYFESRDNKREWMRRLTVNFGDDEGNEITFNGTVVQALMMMNGEQLNDAIAIERKAPVEKKGPEKKGAEKKAMDKKAAAKKELNSKGTIIAAAERKGGSMDSIVGELYLAALNRPPTNEELNRIRAVVRSAPVKNKSPIGYYEDIFWALLNCNEFILNH